MNAEEIFIPGSSSQLVPQADPARQAVASLRGYAYQVLATALAWLDIDEHSQIYLEVAEDYAIVAKDAILGVQVKDTERSESVTSRDDIPALLLGLQHLYSDEETRSRLFALLEEHMLPGVDRNSVSVRNAITNFIDLVERNPDTSVDLRFFTTSDIGTEQAIADHPDNMAGLLLLETFRCSRAGANTRGSGLRASSAKGLGEQQIPG